MSKPKRKRRSLKQRLGDVYQRIVSLNGPPRPIALGVALGMAIAVFPVIGTHTVILFIACAILRANVTAGFLVSWLGNPLTIPLYAAIEYEFGRLLLYPIYGRTPVPSLKDLTWTYLKGHVLDVLVPLGAGAAVLMAAVGLVAYVASYRLIVRYRTSGVLP